MNDPKQMWIDAYEEAKTEHPDWTDEQLEKAATNGMSNQISNIVDAYKNE